MARLARFFLKDQPQHIIQRGNNKDVIFAHEADYQFYLESLAQAAKVNELKIHAYVLMTNHVHLLASPLHEQSIPKTLQSLGRRYVQYFNRSYGRTGTLWEGRFCFIRCWIEIRTANKKAIFTRVGKKPDQRAILGNIRTGLY